LLEHQLTIFEGGECGDRANTKLAGDHPFFLGVHLRERDVLVFDRGGFEHGPKSAARATPGCPKIDDEDVIVFDLFLEIGFGEIECCHCIFPALGDWREYRPDGFRAVHSICRVISFTKCDLKVDKKYALQTLHRSHAWIQTPSQHTSTPEEAVLSQTQTDCILCDSCYSACPVFAVNPDFLGPFSLTRAYRYSGDKRESNHPSLIESIQTNGVWDCILCGECTAVCPKGIDPKMDITMLRSESIQQGYSDPSFETQAFAVPDFSNHF